MGTNRARANLSAAFSWAMRAVLVDNNPVIGTIKGEEAPRKRVLAPAELGGDLARDQRSDRL